MKNVSGVEIEGRRGERRKGVSGVLRRGRCGWVGVWGIDAVRADVEAGREGAAAWRLGDTRWSECGRNTCSHTREDSRKLYRFQPVRGMCVQAGALFPGCA